MVFHHNIEEVQPSYLDSPDTRADNGEKNHNNESSKEITFFGKEKDPPKLQEQNTASPEEESPDEEMQSYYQTILLNSLKTYKEEEEEHINYFSSNLDPVAEVEEETRFTEIDDVECQATHPQIHCQRSCCTPSASDQVSEQSQHVPWYVNKKISKELEYAYLFLLRTKV